MKDGIRVLIVGGVACGPKTASRLKCLMPNEDVTMIERGRLSPMAHAAFHIMWRVCFLL
ncbi:MAG: hypothetical protein ABSC04_09890 [Syntrophobacteraceae bacterium]